MEAPLDDEPVYGSTKYDEAVRIDYSVLSVGVMTLGLILVVEVARHNLDHYVEHSAFYQAVLKGVYSELATLGVVEFLLHVMAEYYEEYDKAKKHVFADVHFLLFYTAILNALQSALLFKVVQRISKKLWIDTEKLDVGHYVELREEFDSVHTQLEKLRRRRNVGRQNAHTANEGPDDAESPMNTLPIDEGTDEGVTGAVRSIMDRIRYPALKSKYSELLVQVRFHELRVHFLQAYNLPVKFQVSDYLMRSEQHVLLQLINVSPIAWLLLTGLVNLLYFVLGIASYQMRSAKLVGIAMIYMFFSAIFLFVVLSWIVHRKMKMIYKQIMNSETLWNVHNEFSTERAHLAEEQKSLFWAGDPTLVIAAIQFMQFGYAVAVSTIIIFWEELNDGPTPMAVYVLVVCACYAVFIAVTAHIIPRYTLCTNLAQLVDVQRLHEAVASFRLNEAKHREIEKAEIQHLSLLETDSLVSSVPSMISTSKLGTGSSTGGASSAGDHASAVLIRDMVKSDTSTLRANLPDSVKLAVGSKQRTKNRVKQFSDGVSAMARNNFLSAIPRPNHDEHSLSMSSHAGNNDAAAQTVTSRRRKARSEGVSFMAHAEHLALNEIPRTNGFTDDDLSFESSSSGHSDINDIPIVSTVRHANSAPKEQALVSLKSKLYAYFTSRRFIVISNVFGTMVMFFFLAQRVESFYISEGIGRSSFVHFDFAHDYVFWLLFTWLAFFMVKSVLVFYSIGCRQLVSRKEQTIVVATVLDVFLTVGGMLLFLYAESQRCCNPDEHEDFVIDEDEKSHAPCSCPAFGSRQYGGLGPYEPWVSLVALRLFRHWFAQWIVLITEQDKHLMQSDTLLHQQSRRFNPFITESDQDHKPGHQHSKAAHRDDHEAQEPKGTAAELWETAIGRHPDIVARHGEFSAEILRVMLGLESANVATDKAEDVDRGNRDHSAKKSFTVQKCFAHLSEGAQRVIAAGALGGDVVECPTSTFSGQPQFQLCRLSRQNSELSMFLAPNALLIRSMRRCDKKFLPLLVKWTVVDVVMTRFEIVYFAADSIDCCDLDGSAEVAREALTATKGGKGSLRLCDAARGRRVVGRMDLADLVAVHVDRLAGEDANKHPIENSNVEVENFEFWKRQNKSSVGHENKPRGERWASVTQDVLRLKTGHGETVYLRFYSDLEDGTNIPGLYANDDYDKGQVAKNNALHWAQTIGRICGREQLNQSLAHFGQGDSQELYDYLVVKSHSKSQPHSHFSATKGLGVQLAI